MSAFAVPTRLLLGSGPSPVPERVLRALARPTIGHLDPMFGALMEEVAELLRETFVTHNRATLPVSGTGSAGMEAMVANLVEPGDRVVCAVHGAFGARMADELGRRGAEVVAVRGEWGRALPIERLIEAAGDGCAAIFAVHGETSTGVRQSFDGLADACRERDALLLADCVTSLSGVPFALDAWGIDAAFSGTQKCLNCPPGLAPLTVGDRGLDKLRARERPGPSWYFDLSLVLAYWDTPALGSARVYHHTAPINLVYALREALAIVHEEGLEERFARHARAHEALRSALEPLGFERVPPAEEALASLLCVRVPDGIDEVAVRGRLLREHGIEVSGGLGPLAGQVWRIGVMGEGARPEPQERLVRAVAAELGADATGAIEALEHGWSVPA